MARWCRHSSRVSRRMHGVKTVIVSIGANEMPLDAADGTVPGSHRNATTRRPPHGSPRRLDSFTIDYYDLLPAIGALPGLPRVIVNEYYDPPPMAAGLRGRASVTAAKSAVLTSRLGTFNTVHSPTAPRGFGFDAVAPSFRPATSSARSNRSCRASTMAPRLHPNAAGEIAIALADEEALLTPALAPTGPVAATPTPS